MATAKSNRKNIMKNRKAVFGLECQVTANKANAYATRSSIEENRALILKNYTAALKLSSSSSTSQTWRGRQPHQG